jgi:hypothetical protein
VQSKSTSLSSSLRRSTPLLVYLFVCLFVDVEEKQVNEEGLGVLFYYGT